MRVDPCIVFLEAQLRRFDIFCSEQTVTAEQQAFLKRINQANRKNIAAWLNTLT